MFSPKRYLGLDIGTTGPKGVVLERAGKKLRIVDCRRLDNVAEGILNEAELYQDIGGWLQENGWKQLPCCPRHPAISGVYAIGRISQWKTVGVGADGHVRDQATGRSIR